MAEEAKEKAPQPSAVPEEHKAAARKSQARKEIDAIYEQGKYDTYNFRKLPQEFKDHIKHNFGEWIDANVDKYDEDKDSGIDAAEYEKFKAKLTEKVEGILARLIELKKEKKKEAEQVKETAEQAKEKQKRLEGVDVTKINEANLDSADGMYTELLKYQKDFENEAEKFSSLAGTFTTAKEKVDYANQSHHTGLTGLGEYLVALAPWAEDIPEVKEAKAAKEKALSEFQTKLAEMKKRQKDRQERGKTLNGAPEKLRGTKKKKYDEYRKKIEAEQKDVAKQKEKNAGQKAEAEKKLNEIEETRKKLQQQYEELAVKAATARKRAEEVQQKKEEMGEATKGLAAAGTAVEEGAKKPGEVAGGAPKIPEYALAQIRAAQEKAAGAEQKIGAGEEAAVEHIGYISGTMAGLQTQLAKLLKPRGALTKTLTTCRNNEKLLKEGSKKLDTMMKDLTTAEEEEMKQIDSLDQAIADTVLEVDTGNFELIKQAENYLKTLGSLDVGGPGFLDMGGAVLKGIPGLEKGTGWAGDKLDGAWKWCQEAPVLGDAIQIVGYMGEGWVKGWDAIGDGLSWAGDKLHLQEAWDWMSEASKHLSIGNPTGNPLADAILDTFSGGGLGTLIEVFAGVTEGSKDLVKGLGMMVQHPFETIKGLGHLLNHPGKIIDAFLQKDKWSTESSGKIIGRMMLDAVLTLTGVGATATGVKTAVAAVKIGGMSVGRAIILGGKTFVEVFVRDIGKLLGGVVKLPATLAKGTGKLLIGIAKGGKKSEKVAEAAAATKKASTAEDAYKAVEAARGKPAEFKKLIAEHPEYLDLHAKVVKRLGQMRKKLAAEAKSKPGKTGPGKGEKPTGPATMEAATAPAAGPAAAKKAELKQAVEAAKAKVRAAHAAQLEVVQDFSVKKRTPERVELFDQARTKIEASPAAKELAKKGIDYHYWAERLPDYDLRLLASRASDLTIELMENVLMQKYRKTVDDSGQVVRFYEGRQLGKGGYGVVTDCAYVIGDGTRLKLGAVKKPRDIKILEDEASAITKQLQEGKGKLKPERESELRGRLAAINFELHNLKDVFQRELRGMAAVKAMGETEGLLHPRVVSMRTLEESVIIYDKIDDVSGRKVNLGDRLVGDESIETILGFLEDSFVGLDRLHAEGWVHLDYKPGNVFVGTVEGAARGHLGDLSMIHYTDLPHLEIMPITKKDPLHPGKTVTYYAVLKKGPSGLVRDSRQIAVTLDYFSAAHLEKLIAEAKAFVADLDQKHVPLESALPPKHLLAVGDTHQAGVTLARYRDLLDPDMARTKLQAVEAEIRKTPPSNTARRAELKERHQTYTRALAMAEGYQHIYGDDALRQARADLDQLAARLKDPTSGIEFSEVIEHIRTMRVQLERARRRAAKGPGAGGEAAAIL